MSNGDGGQSAMRKEYDEPEAVARTFTSRVVTSSFCHWDQPQCVEVEAQSNGDIAVTDSKMQPGSPVLFYTREEWEAFVAGVKNGEFDYERLVDIGKYYVEPKVTAEA